MAPGRPPLEIVATPCRHGPPFFHPLVGDDAVELVKPRVAVPIHYEGWKHVHEGRDDVERALAAAPTHVGERFRRIPIGQPSELSSRRWAAGDRPAMG